MNIVVTWFCLWVTLQWKIKKNKSSCAPSYVLERLLSCSPELLKSVVGGRQPLKQSSFLKRHTEVPGSDPSHLSCHHGCLSDISDSGQGSHALLSTGTMCPPAPPSLNRRNPENQDVTSRRTCGGVGNSLLGLPQAGPLPRYISLLFLHHFHAFCWGWEGPASGYGIHSPFLWRSLACKDWL